ncbi:MAG: alpha-L-fucosidase [Kiritimatiellia bacterium]|jgi:alpha-L-fucosidase|nr:alpha-L-fucosidase [Kiritimatiellia bacterium]MDP6629376.1 alpha-L-fucosidase [Kiritimatiellia bacterium]MDP6811359.1 alpha-L-fucosidase [Kiritimatiellia bacterium]MDP7024400.1 alpha-L-fucosidase [Kiritimatiellia bacterium]
MPAVSSTADTKWFQESRFGMFIHWGLYSQAARHEWVKNRECITSEDYQKYFDIFDPDLYDPRAWARAAREAGMKYFVITTKHHEGFCLWDSKHTDYKATNTPCGKDLLKEMVDAFRAEGLRVGFYYSLIDWHHPEFPVDRIHPQRDDEDFREKTKERDVKQYAAYMREQVRELLTDFGQIDILWFDFSYPGDDGKGHEEWESEELVKMIRELQPSIMINNRLDLPGVGDLVTPEQYVPSEAPKDEHGNPAVWEGCQTFSGSWGYHRDEATWKSVPMLIQMLINHVSRGGNLLLNVGPTARGEFDVRALNSLSGMGEWMKQHSRAIYGCTQAPEEFEAPLDCRYTWNPETNRLYCHIFAWPFRALHLPGMQGKIKYAQLLNDASEIKFRDAQVDVHANLNASTPQGAVTLVLPPVKPDVEVPVVELFL